MLRKTFIVALLFAAANLAQSGEVLDRMAATVNGNALLQSDVDEEFRYEFLAAKRPLSEASAEDRKGALDRLIDQELLREQMNSRDFKPVAMEDVSKATENFKSEYGAAWATALRDYGLTEVQVKNHIQIELNQLRLIDLRLRPTVLIDADSIRTYYQQQLLPKLPPGQHPSLQEAGPTIRELLVQQKMNEALDAWLEALRSQAKIQRFQTGDQAK